METDTTTTTTTRDMLSDPSGDNDAAWWRRDSATDADMVPELSNNSTIYNDYGDSYLATTTEPSMSEYLANISSIDYDSLNGFPSLDAEHASLLNSTERLNNQTNSSIILQTIGSLSTTEIIPGFSETTQGSGLPPMVSEGGLSPMETWFLITGCIIIAVIILMILNGLIYYKDQVKSTLKRITTPSGEKLRVTGEASRFGFEEEKTTQTHIFYHPFFHRSDDRNS